jgi:thiol-disulfide isomerase/thioredoxin
MVAPRKRLATTVALLSCASLGCATAAAISGQASSIDAPLTVQLLDGSTLAWPSLLASQDTTLVVFATLWCEICRKERPAVEAWARVHRSARTVYVFSGSALPQVAALATARAVDTAALTVIVDADGKLADRYAVQATPTLLLLGSDGRVLATQHRFAALDLQ